MAQRAIARPATASLGMVRTKIFAPSGWTASYSASSQPRCVRPGWVSVGAITTRPALAAIGATSRAASSVAGPMYATTEESAAAASAFARSMAALQSPSAAALLRTSTSTK